ncbi:MAG: hypothetical protein SFU85_10265 [Candidatus Methylacidiphilales bacterium]|nr:hypothetical protein [Candidatus Methylacidiphilales bacterium]
MNESQVFEGRSHGRLDVLGGVAEYSGALVLQMPTRGETVVRARLIDQPELRFRSEGMDEAVIPLEWWTGLLRTSGGGAALRGVLQERRLAPWTFYLVGCLWTLALEKGWVPTRGIDIEVHSGLPVSCGVSSSSALTVATLRALAELAGLALPETESAALAHKAEGDFVGAPCRLVDSLACAHVQSGYLLPILCRPDQVQRPVAVPPGICLVGWPSGVRHAVFANPHARVRTASFMGRKMLERATGRKVAQTSDFTPMEYHQNQEHLAVAMRGEDFLDAWGGVDDPLSVIDPQTVYPVRAATQFAIEENDRAARTVASLQRFHLEQDESLLWEIGGHFFASHTAYGAMGLGCAETDLMVDYLRNRPLSEGIYGARVSAGGCGGTVVVLLKESSLPRLSELCARLTPAVSLIP